MAASVETGTASLGADFVELAEHALASGRLEAVSDAELERIMTAAVRLYAAKAEAAGASAQKTASRTSCSIRWPPTDWQIAVMRRFAGRIGSSNVAFCGITPDPGTAVEGRPRIGRGCVYGWGSLAQTSLLPRESLLPGTAL